MALTYIGTRDRSIKATASEAILRGICPDGGAVYSGGDSQNGEISGGAGQAELSGAGV